MTADLNAATDEMENRSPIGNISESAWPAHERRLVLNGFLGRVAIAVEPVICGAFFAVLTIWLASKGHDVMLMSPMFGFATLLFTADAVCVMVPPIRAFIQTFAPIYIVDGYVRYRATDHVSDYGENGYVAVLNEERRTIAEWPSVGDDVLPDRVTSAMIEFSHFGGIHRIDGRSTGVLPESVSALGIGVR